MGMPDFSFLQNQQGTSTFGDLAKGLAQGAQMGMNIQSMQLQQAAQKQAMENAQNQQAMEAAKLTMDMNKQTLTQKRMEFIQKGLEGVARPGMTPQDYNTAASGYMASIGEHAAAKDYAAASAHLAEKDTKDQFISIPSAGPTGRNVNIMGRKLPGNSDFVDPRFKAAGVEAPPGYAYVSTGGESASLIDMNNKTITGQAADRGKALDMRSAAAAEQQKWLDVFSESSANMGAVPAPKLAEKLGGVASFLGIQVPQIKDLASANLASSQIGMAMLQRFVGTTTEKELGFSLDQAPAMWNDPSARKQLVSILSKIGDMDRKAASEYAKFEAKSLTEGGSGLVAGGKSWEEHWDAYKEAHPIASKEQIKLFKARASAVEDIKRSLVSQSVDPVSGRPVGVTNDNRYFYLDTYDQARTK